MRIICNRMPITASIVGFILCSLLASCGEARVDNEGDLVLRNVTVVSPERAGPLAGAWIAVRGGRIAAVATRGPVPASWTEAAAT